MELYFDPSIYTNHQVGLFKLQQTTSVTEYQCCFERLCNCIVGLTPKTILNCFIYGLYIEIHIELAILNPYSISHAIDLAKLIEDNRNLNKIVFPYLTTPILPVAHQQQTRLNPISSPNNNYYTIECTT